MDVFVRGPESIPPGQADLQQMVMTLLLIPLF
jgi:hypothetical protein